MQSGFVVIEICYLGDI